MSDGTVLVIGEPLLDVSYFGCGISTHPENGALRVEKWTECRKQPGGAGNAAAQVRYCAPAAWRVAAAVTANKIDSDVLRSSLPLSGVSVVSLPGVVPDEMAVRQRYYVGDGPKCAVQLDGGYASAFTDESLFALRHTLDYFKPSAVLLCDHGSAPVAVCRKLSKLLEIVPVVVVATRRPLSSGWYKLGSHAVVVSNRREFNTGASATQSEAFESGDGCNRRASFIVTGDSQGAFVRWYVGSVEHRVATPYVSSPFSVGAGDAFAAALTVALTEQLLTQPVGQPRNLIEAARLACVGASYYVSDSLRHVPGIDSLHDVSDVAARRLVESPVDAVFPDHGFDLLPGCFDMLHDGHRKLLREASANGRQILVAVNTDDSVRSLKGETRPIRPLADRMLDIAHWAAVSRLTNVLVTSFDGSTHDLLLSLPETPQHIVKGAQYCGSLVPGSDICPVKFVPMLDGFSTTALSGGR